MDSSVYLSRREVEFFSSNSNSCATVPSRRSELHNIAAERFGTFLADRQQAIAEAESTLLQRIAADRLSIKAAERKQVIAFCGVSLEQSIAALRLSIPDAANQQAFAAAGFELEQIIVAASLSKPKAFLKQSTFACPAMLVDETKVTNSRNAVILTAFISRILIGVPFSWESLIAQNRKWNLPMGETAISVPGVHDTVYLPCWCFG